MKKGLIFSFTVLMYVFSLGMLAAISFVEPLPPTRNPAFSNVAIFLNVVNLTLCTVLIFIYFQIWRKTRSEFTVGLIILSMALFFHTIVANPLISNEFGYPHYNLGPFTLLPVLFTTIALSILLYLASK
ncbi:MAG TPA: hypothetical protein PK718_07220 [Candidatus Methanofastidiosa archaeon]|nr:hypothetical protein [Candidatus Methanofastidiosa archaeon]